MIYHFYQKKWKLINVKKVCNLKNEKEDAVHVRTLKQVLDHGLVLKNT